MEGNRTMKSRSIACTAGLILFSAALDVASAQEDATSATARTLNPLGGLTTSDAKAFLERPLFTPTRRPIEIDAVAAVAGDDIEEAIAADPELMLLGVTSGPDGSIARIATEDGAERRSVRVGEEIDGWTIQAIDPSAVTVTRAGQTVVLAIFKTIETSADAGENDETDEAPGIVFGADDTSDRIDDAPKVRVISRN